MSVTQPKAPWWREEIHGRRRPGLVLRARLASAVRAWFDAQDFIETDTAALAPSPGNETHLHAFATTMLGPGLEPRALYLHTSPEFAMKKLLAAGEERIYQLAPVFRDREQGALHHPAFTMLEWYRARAPYETLFTDCAAILGLAAALSGQTLVSFRGRTCDLRAAPVTLTVAAAFARHAGIDLLAVVDDRDAFAAQARAQGIAVGADYTWSDIFSRVLVERIEHKLGIGQSTLLTQYPVAEAALASVSPHDARVAERFELYVCGVELANGFGELTDPAEQRLRLERQMAERQRIYGERYPLDEDFLAALAHMPPASGCALGFDRLVMLAAGASSVDEVMWMPVC